MRCFFFFAFGSLAPGMYFFLFTFLLLGLWLQTFALFTLNSLTPNLVFTFVRLGHWLQNLELLLLGYWPHSFTFLCFHLAIGSNIAAVLHLLTKPQLGMDRFRVWGLGLIDSCL